MPFGFSPFALFFTLVAGLVSVPLASATDYNLLQLKGGIEIRLPELPTNPEQLEQFQSLTPHEQKSFYVKRQFLIRRMTVGLAKPGLKRGIQWMKRKVYAFKELTKKVKDRFSAAETVMGAGDLPDSVSVVAGEEVIEWQSIPENLSDNAKKLIESTITGLVENLWSNSRHIAKLDGFGLTFVGGGIWNTTMPLQGLVYGRGYSLDIGVNFKTQTGYMRILYDKQALKTPGLSFDVGLMFDVLAHATNPELTVGDHIEATHVKLPTIGCFRYGPSYIAWGAQMGYSVVEMVGTWMLATGQATLGAAIITGMRALGAVTVYSTTLDRPIVKVFKDVSPEKLRRLGLGPLLEAAQALKQEADCDDFLQN